MSFDIKSTLFIKRFRFAVHHRKGLNWIITHLYGLFFPFRELPLSLVEQNHFVLFGAGGCRGGTVRTRSVVAAGIVGHWKWKPTELEKEKSNATLFIWDCKCVWVNAFELLWLRFNIQPLFYIVTIPYASRKQVRRNVWIDKTSEKKIELAKRKDSRHEWCRMRGQYKYLVPR